MGQTIRFREVLRRLALVDVIQDQAGLRLGSSSHRHMDPKTAALAAVGAPGVCLEWSTTRALAAGASEDEICDVLLVIAPVAGLGRVVGAVTDVADALGYDVEAELVDRDDH